MYEHDNSKMTSESKEIMEVEETFSNESEDMFAETETEIETGEDDKTWKGAEKNILNKYSKPVTAWKETKVFVKHQNWALPYPNDRVEIWDNYHVRLPWSNHNEFPKDGKVVKRYGL